jgi:hypothetical protein
MARHIAKTGASMESVTLYITNQLAFIYVVG